MPGERKILGFFAGSSILLAALSFALSGGWRQSSTVAPGILNLSASVVVELRDGISGRVLAGHFVPRATEAHQTLRVALLVAASGGAVGSAEIELNRHPNGTLLQELEIDVEGLSPHAVYDILVDGRAVGVLSTDGRGAGEFERFAAVMEAPLRSGD